MSQNTAMVPPLEISNLTKNYGLVEAVKNVSFALNSGEVFGLLGPNGAGKTSIISCIVTLEKPTKGVVRVGGFDVQKSPREAKANVGFVPQEIINHGYFDVLEILHFQSGYFGLRKNDERINYILNELRLYEHRNKKVKQLSGGMKRRLLIAKALVHSPRLLLLDEPTAGVDIELREQLWQFVRKLKAEGVTILLTTHYLEEAEQLCDRVGLIDKGEIKMIERTQFLIDKFTGREVKIKVRDHVEPKKYLLEHGQTVGELLHQQKLDVNQIEDINISEGTLEDAFRRVIYK
jgi:ABC-2 type transport system ATP-binding protein